MCGIFGAISFKKKFNESNWYQFKELTDLVSYRGPDGSGYYCADDNSGFEHLKDNFNLFFGHRRLSIIDLSTFGAQPMSIGNLVIIFNGEIYNYIELKAELKSLCCHFETNTDTEVILKLYEMLGEKAFSKMNGMWAFAIYDKLNHKVILSRDRFSEKPLFYYQDTDHFFFLAK